MKKTIILTFCIISLCSCSVPKSLYYWGGTYKDASVYENLTYQNYDKQTPESICNLICAYEDIIKNPTGLRKMPPPGICAEYGYLLLKGETPEIFSKYATTKQKKIFTSQNYGEYFGLYGIELLEKELQLYPEPAKFIKPLLDKLKR